VDTDFQALDTQLIGHIIVKYITTSIIAIFIKAPMPSHVLSEAIRCLIPKSLK
jgi:hypothetical protein